MAKRFVRNIIDTDLEKEPFNTNLQNDIISDHRHIAIRNGMLYHILTDSLKFLRTNTPRVISFNHYYTTDERHEVTISVVETEIESEDSRLQVDNYAPNKFKLDLDLSVIENNIASNATNISNLQSQLTSLTSRVSALESQNTMLFNENESLKEISETTKKDLTSTKRELTKTKNELKELRGDNNE